MLTTVLGALIMCILSNGMNIIGLDPNMQKVVKGVILIFAVTMTGRLTEDALLVTGNIRHFPAKPFVVTPAQFIEMLESQRQS